MDGNQRQNAKHVSKACLECRSKHVKCTGETPKCARCVKYGVECNYVKSNRGGARQKGVKKQKLLAPKSIYFSVKDSNGIDDIETLPCVSGLAKSMSRRECAKSCVDPKPACLSGKSDESVDFDFVRTRPFDMSEYEEINESQINEIVNLYYENFHETHPFLPPKDDIKKYILSLSHSYDLLAAMKIIADGQSTENLYNKENDTKIVQEKVLKILFYIEGNEEYEKDLVTLQSYFLLAMVTHISSLHTLSCKIREKAIELLIGLKLHLMDINSLPGNYMDINGNNTKIISIEEKDNPQLYSSKFRDLKVTDLSDASRRIFWELYFFDIIIGTASGNTTSKLCDLSIFLKFPEFPHKSVFNYEIRSQLSKIVNDSIKLNIAITNQSSYKLLLLKINGALGNWELILSNPKLFNEPYLVNNNGEVNNGIHQAMMMYSYAKIYTHRPFSYIYKPDILPQQPKCCGESVSSSSENESGSKDGPGENTNGGTSQNFRIVSFDSRKIIETRKTIDAANSIVNALIDTNTSTIRKRTPLISCSLAFAALVHLSSYFWIESKLNKNTDDQNDIIKSDELNIFEEYLKLELNGIYAISNQWFLSNKLGTHIRETTRRVLPKLYNRISNYIPFGKPDNSNNDMKDLKKKNDRLMTDASNANEIYNDESYTNHMGDIESSHQLINDMKLTNDELMFQNSDSFIYPDTGCDWIDKSGGFFDAFDILENDPSEVDYTFKI